MFKPRLTKPEAGNKYYNTKANGGYSIAIKGKPTDPDCDVLSNCVGYAYGRFNEIGEWGSCKYLYPTNAENFMEHKGNLEVGQTPRVGACMVWQKGNTLSGTDGAGHVAIVEKVISETEVLTSESGWNSSTPFWTKTRKKGADGRWGSGTSYKFLGFIYNPAECCQGEPEQEAPKVETPKEEAKEQTATNSAQYFSKPLAGTYKVTASWLNVRNGAGTNQKVMVTIPRGTKVKNYGYYSKSNGVNWLYVQFTYNGVKYTAFATSQYLQK